MLFQTWKIAFQLQFWRDFRAFKRLQPVSLRTQTHYWPPFIWVNYNISASSKFQKWWLNKTEMGTNPSRVTSPSATQIGPCQRDEWHKEANRTPKRSSPCESSHHLICSNWKFCTAKTWVKLPVFGKKTGVFFQKIRPFENYSEKKGWLPSSW